MFRFCTILIDLFYLVYFTEDRTVSIVKRCQITEGCRVEPGCNCHVKIKRKCYEGIVVTYVEYMQLLRGNVLPRMSSVRVRGRCN